MATSQARRRAIPRSESAIVEELEELRPRLAELDELAVRRDELALALVLTHGWTRAAAAELAGVSRQWVDKLVTKAKARHDGA